MEFPNPNDNAGLATVQACTSSTIMNGRIPPLTPLSFSPLLGSGRSVPATPFHNAKRGPVAAEHSAEVVHERGGLLVRGEVAAALVLALVHETAEGLHLSSVCRPHSNGEREHGGMLGEDGKRNR